MVSTVQSTKLVLPNAGWRRNTEFVMKQCFLLQDSAKLCTTRVMIALPDISGKPV
jgi:hypothetical protein